MLLTDGEIQVKLGQLRNWTWEGKSLCCERKFKGFPEAVAFVQSMVDPAERAAHHPDLEISYNRVTIRLTTHDQGGLTQKDFDLARIIETL